MSTASTAGLAAQLEGSRKMPGPQRARAERPSAWSAQRAVTFGKRGIKAEWLTLEQHRFELHGSIYTLSVANKYSSNSTIHSWLKLQMRISDEGCCCCCCQVPSVVSDLVRLHRRQPTRLPVPGILQARTLERVTISFSNA